MGLAGKSFDGINEGDLQELVSTGVPEGILTEYKRDPYGAADADKKEFLKDLSSFANTSGGHLVIGMAEASGVPVGLAAIADRDPDSELQRLESLTRDGIEPRILGVHMRSVPISTGGFVIVIRVPRSWAAPHRVAIKGSNRFYGRTSAGAYEFSVTELRAKFNASANALDRALAFRDRRLALLAADEGIVPLARVDGRLTVHIVPLAGTGETTVDLEAAHQLNALLAPIDSASWSPEFNYDGFANIRSGELVFGYTQLFRDGGIEATKARIVAVHEGMRRVPARALGDAIVKAVPNYLDALIRLGVSPPFSVMITLEGVRGASLAYSRDRWFEDNVIRRDTLELPPSIIQEYAGRPEYEAALRPAFDALWNAGGLSKCTYFTDQNRWHPHS